MATVRTKGSSSTARRRSNAPPRWSVAALELVYELLTTTERLAAARHWDGRVVLRSDAAWSLLRMIERLPYCPSISDLGRLLHISRQAAYERCPPRGVRWRDRSRDESSQSTNSPGAPHAPRTVDVGCRTGSRDRVGDRAVERSRDARDRLHGADSPRDPPAPRPG
jgi:hypothetical protein